MNTFPEIESANFRAAHEPVAASQASLEESFNGYRFIVLPFVILGAALAWELVARWGISTNLSTVLQSILGFAAIVGWMVYESRQRRYSLKRALGGWPNAREGVSSIALAVVLVFAAMAVIGFDDWVGPSPYEFDLPSVADEGPGWTAAYGLVATAIAPWVEELLFRGLLFRMLRVRWGGAVAIVVSSGLFSVGHSVFVGPFFMGVVLCLVYTSTNSLWPCIIIHTANNFLAGLALPTLISFIGQSASDVVMDPVAQATFDFWAWVVLAIISFPLVAWQIARTWHTRNNPLPG